ncbi:hypothetical protein DPM19_22075 [Actinomadura craniellae]|uniref:Uncharacterized protein n=1 Tax=Actinomadura craniellae TaxID=2231787 RepID=A0A365H259_9ACTN|nr:DUF6177 family protein [Actinomadura craniellae]RAY13180.1 hypothetical protein DPM19_22075 [Actinomadura craniellae]
MSAHPAVDILTARTAVVIQDRPLVPLSSWLIDAMAACARGGLAFQVLTPDDSRITLPLRMALNISRSRWVVQEPGDAGYYDGFSGMPLEWNGAAFAPVDAGTARSAGPSPAFTRPVPDLGAQLLVDLRVLHPAAAELELGQTIELLADRLAGTEPTAWGTGEPTLSRWLPAEVTELCRRRSPQPTRLVFTGPNLIGTHQVSRVTSGVTEAVMFVTGRAADEPSPLDDLAELAGELAARGTLQTMTVQRTAGPADLTYVPRWCGAPAPVGLAIGPAGVAEVGLEHALAAPVGGRPIGDPDEPALWYPLEDDAPGDWTEFAALLRHLGPAQ